MKCWWALPRRIAWPAASRLGKQFFADYDFGSPDEAFSLRGRAIANGKATKAFDHIEYVWNYNGKTVVVRTSTGGHVSNGWVR